MFFDSEVGFEVLQNLMVGGGLDSLPFARFELVIVRVVSHGSLIEVGRWLLVDSSLYI